MHVCYSPYAGPDDNSGTDQFVSPGLLVSLSSPLTMGYRKHEFRLNNGYIVVSGHSAAYILVVKPGNMLCLDSDVHLQK